MLSENDIKEELSNAFVHAIASHCGFGFDRPGKDRDSVDVVITAKGKLDTSSIITSPRLDLQMKATCEFSESNGTFGLRIKKKNYDELRPVDVMVPRLLVVLVLPEEKQNWLVVDTEQLIARRCAFWCNLKGMPEIETETTTIRIPIENRFDAETLRLLLTKISKGEAL